MKTIRIFMAFCAMAVLFAANVCAQEERTEIILGCEKSFLTASVWIAESKGYFQEEGINVTIKEYDSGKASFHAMIRDNASDISTVAQTPIMFNSFKQNDFAIIAAMVHSDNDVKVLARQDKGIKNPLDLKGKKVGMTKGSTGQFFLDLFLTYKGLTFSEVEAIDFGPADLPQALADGQVDAICTWEPHIMHAKELLGEKAFLLSIEAIYREDFYFVVTDNFIENNPGVLRRFLKAIEKGEEFIQENKEESIDIVYKRLKLHKGPCAPLIWDMFNFELILDQSVLTSLEDEARWAIRVGLTDKKEVPNYLDFIYMDALDEVKPEAVTIIR